MVETSYMVVPALKPMEKQGQITIFIIVAIVLLLIIAGYFTLKSSYANLNNIPPAVSPANDYITQCIKMTGEQATFDLGQLGGYAINLGESSTNEGIPYYIQNNKNLVPSGTMLNTQFEIYFANSLPICLNKITGFTLNYSTFNLTTQITNDKIIFNLNSPIIIQKDSQNYLIKGFNNIELNNRFGALIRASQEFVQKQLNQDSGICLSCANEIAQDNNIKIDLINSAYENTTLVRISNPDSKLNNKTQELIFAIKNE